MTLTNLQDFYIYTAYIKWMLYIFIYKIKLKNKSYKIYKEQEQLWV